ncbi:MAG: hypothetical protein WC746_05360 [archaeon]|jgi:hypothetical protein
MAILYVNKSGSNTYDGTSQIFVSGTTGPKLTIQAGITAMATGDSLIVGSGSYNERITLAAKTYYLYADGVVVLDGAGLIGTGSAIDGVSLSSNNLDMTKHSTGGKWIIKNHNVNSATVGLIKLMANVGKVHNLSYLELYGSTDNTVGISIAAGTGNLSTLNISYCTFKDFSDFAIKGGVSAGTGMINAIYNTFYNCGHGIYIMITYGSLIGAYRNIFHTCTTGYRHAGNVNPGGTCNYNSYYNCTNLLYIYNTTYTTLEAVQAISSELQGFSTNPNMIDPANNVFFLSSTGDYGAYPYSSIARGANYNPDSKWIISASADNSGWYNPDGNVTKNGTTGFFELTSGTSGVIWSPVYDLGSIQFVTQFNLASIQTWGTSMVDKTKTDTAPNYQTAEIRMSVTSFDQDAASPDWTEVKINCPFTPAPARYAQVKLTLRNDDVSA